MPSRHTPEASVQRAALTGAGPQGRDGWQDPVAIGRPWQHNLGDPTEVSGAPPKCKAQCDLIWPPWPVSLPQVWVAAIGAKVSVGENNTAVFTCFLFAYR